MPYAVLGAGPFGSLPTGNALRCAGAGPFRSLPTGNALCCAGAGLFGSPPTSNAPRCARGRAFQVTFTLATPCAVQGEGGGGEAGGQRGTTRRLVLTSAALLERRSDTYEVVERRQLGQVAALVRFIDQPQWVAIEWADGARPTMYITPARDALLTALLDAAQVCCVLPTCSRFFGLCCVLAYAAGSLHAGHRSVVCWHVLKVLWIFLCAGTYSQIAWMLGMDLLCAGTW